MCLAALLWLPFHPVVQPQWFGHAPYAASQELLNFFFSLEYMSSDVSIASLSLKQLQVAQCHLEVKKEYMLHRIESMSCFWCRASCEDIIAC
jgi:hypothetical protein